MQMFISKNKVIVNKLTKSANQRVKRLFLKIKLLINSIFKLITLFIKTFTFLLTKVCFRTKLNHIKYEVL